VIRHPGGVLDDGRKVTADLVRSLIPEELAKIRGLIGQARYDGGSFQLASRLFEQLATSDELAEFLTLVAYNHLD
jgi:malate synthase